MPDQLPLVLERRDAVAIISIDDAPLNPMSLDFMDALEQLLEELADDDSVRAMVFTAAGNTNFSVGMDLKQLPAGVERKGSVEALLDQRLRVIARIEQMGKTLGCHSICLLPGRWTGVATGVSFSPRSRRRRANSDGRL